MKTTDIIVTLSNSSGTKACEGRGYFDYPFVIHRPQGADNKLDNNSNVWYVTHIASGRRAFAVATLSDASKMTKLLRKHPVFFMPLCDKFLKICTNQGPKIRKSLMDAGYCSNSMRFIEKNT